MFRFSKTQKNRDDNITACSVSFVQTKLINIGKTLDYDWLVLAIAPVDLISCIYILTQHAGTRFTSTSHLSNAM